MSVQDSGESDAKILRITNQLIEQFRISDFKPARISWEAHLIGRLGTFTGPRLKLVSPGLCKFTWDEIMLPEGLKRKLEPEEWRPLLASSLIYEAKLKVKKTLGILATGAASALLGGALIAILSILDPVAANYMVVPDFFILIILLLMRIPFVNPFLRSLRLQADRLAVQQFGKERVLQILEKINSCLLYTSPSPRDLSTSRMPSSA